MVILSLFISTAIYSQAEDDNRLYNRKLNEQKWKELREDVRYKGKKQNGAGRQWTYESDEEYYEAKRKSDGFENDNDHSGDRWTGNDDGATTRDDDPNEMADHEENREIDTPDPDIQMGEGLSVLGWILLIAFIIGLGFLIYYLFLKTPKDGSKVVGEYQLEEKNPTEIPLTELQRLLNEALAKGDYRGAVRIYFIFIIKDLTEKRWIKWEKEKTNLHYLREMSGRKEFDDFNQSVSYFEIIWYGERELDASKFEAIKPSFTKFLDKLGVK